MARECDSRLSFRLAYDKKVCDMKCVNNDLRQAPGKELGLNH